MVLMPQMMQDQDFNALRVERLGFGVYIDKTLYSAELLDSKIKQVLNDNR